MRAGELLVFVIGGAATVVVAAFPAARFAYPRPALHIALETAAALVAFIAALLVLGRYRQRGRLDDLLLLAALATLSTTNLFFAAIPAALAQTKVGAFTTWAPLIGRLIGAVLLASAALVKPVVLRTPARAAMVVAAALAMSLAVVGIGISLAGPNLPTGVDPKGPVQSASLSYLSTHTLLSTSQFVTMVLYAVAAIGFSGRREPVDDELPRWLALGATFAALSALNYGLFPSLYTDWVYTGDLYRLLFYLVLLIGAARVITTYWRNQAMVAVLEERARVARDLHDGVAQELAFITRRARRMSSTAGDAALDQIAAAAQRALVDSRLVIAALTRPIDEPFEIALRQTVEDAADRLGAHVELDIATGVTVGTDAREALIRVATEAVSNAARHAPGARIRVMLTGDPVCLRVSDEGDGFDPDAVLRTTHSGFGLTSMRERAKALGADLRISSTPGRGTDIEMVLP